MSPRVRLNTALALELVFLAGFWAAIFLECPTWLIWICGIGAILSCWACVSTPTTESQKGTP